MREKILRKSSEWWGFLPSLGYFLLLRGKSGSAGAEGRRPRRAGKMRPARRSPAYLTATRTELSSAPADMVRRARGGRSLAGSSGPRSSWGTAAAPPHLLLLLRHRLSPAILGD